MDITYFAEIRNKVREILKKRITEKQYENFSSLKRKKNENKVPERQGPNMEKGPEGTQHTPKKCAFGIRARERNKTRNSITDRGGKKGGQ